MSTYALVATIPARKVSCTRLLHELAGTQSRKVDGVILVLDGYGDQMAPTCPLPVVKELRTAELSGAGQRWRAAGLVEPEDILVNLDDDVMTCEAPRLVEELVNAIVNQHSCASAAMGRTFHNTPAFPGPVSFGKLVHGAGCGLTARAKDLLGVMEFGRKIFADGGPDCLGVGGDDDSLVSAFLWKAGVPIVHAATGNIFAAPNTHDSSYTRGAHLPRGARQAGDEQKHALKRIVGWPWPAPPGKWTS